MSLYNGRAAKLQLRRHMIWTVAIAIMLCQVMAASAIAQTKAADANAAKAVATADGMVAVDAKDPKLGQDWVRLKYDANGQVQGMQTAIVRYTALGPARSAGKAAAPLQVDLIGAVHIADPAYYKTLNERFKKYDVLLYELVAPEGTVVERGRGTSNLHPIGAMQNMFKDVLDLDHQLEDIDYTRPNFVHADMSPDDFSKAMENRHESFLQMYFRLIGEAMAHQSELTANGQNSDFELFSALFAPDRARRLKIVLAKQLSEVESLMVSFGGENGSAIITDRNKRALGVLKEEIAQGKKKIGIFYGAGHLRDMDSRLRNDFHMKPVSIRWLTAWDLAEKK